LTLLVGLFDP